MRAMPQIVPSRLGVFWQNSVLIITILELPIAFHDPRYTGCHVTRAETMVEPSAVLLLSARDLPGEEGDHTHALTSRQAASRSTMPVATDEPLGTSPLGRSIAVAESGK